MSRIKLFHNKYCNSQGGSDLPVLPLDKPHSCKGCKHVLESYALYPLATCKYNSSLYVRTSEKTHISLQYRTWDVCDKYEPVRTCIYCKHYIRKTITYTIADTEQQDSENACQKEGYIAETIGGPCKYWEAKE